MGVKRKREPFVLLQLLLFNPPVFSLKRKVAKKLLAVKRKGARGGEKNLLQILLPSSYVGFSVRRGR